jgi:hypothetical protein
MSVFTLFVFPEDIGEETINEVELQGNIFDLHGRPVAANVSAGLNKTETAYKTQFNLSGAPQTVQSDESTGYWSILLPDNFYMPSDSYSRITIKKEVFRKFLPDFPPENSLNALDDY